MNQCWSKRRKRRPLFKLPVKPRIGFKKIANPYTKRAVLQVSRSVVSVATSFSGLNKVYWGSGIIFEDCNSGNPSAAYYVVTSASIIRRPSFVVDDINNKKPPSAPLLRKYSSRDDEISDKKPPAQTSVIDDEIIDKRPPTTTLPSASDGGDKPNESSKRVYRCRRLHPGQDQDSENSSSETTFEVEEDSSTSDDNSSSVNSFKDRGDTSMNQDGEVNNQTQDDKIFVYLSTGEKCSAEIFVCDDYYNIAVLKIESANQLLTAHLRPLDDSVAIGFCRSVNGQDSLKLVPGDKVIAVGRHDGYLHEIMATPGKYSVVEFDVEHGCKDLLRANCKIDKFGIGGPLISLTGEVIGINFYAEKFTPFLPINIFLKWWEYYKVNQNYRRPWVGVKAATLFAPPVRVWEMIAELNIFHGVAIEKVLPGSPAEAAGIHPSDIIVKCAGRSVRSFLKFLEIIWDEAGKVVDIEVIRNGSSLYMKLEVEDLQ